MSRSTSSNFPSEIHFDSSYMFSYLKVFLYNLAITCSKYYLNFIKSPIIDKLLGMHFEPLDIWKFPQSLISNLVAL
jgi:hypothetical protein